MSRTFTFEAGSQVIIVIPRRSGKGDLGSQEVMIEGKV